MPDVTTMLDGRPFLEGPRCRGDTLFVSDMHAHEVLRVDSAGATEIVARVETCPSGLGFLPDGRMLIVSMEDRRLLRLDGSRLVEAADLSGLAPHEINDMVVDRNGHAFVGQFGYDMHGGESFRPASLLRADPDGSVHEAARDLQMANGMAIANDDRTLVVAESAGRALLAFDIADDGTLSNRRVWAPLPFHPDGICLDAEDGVWVACPVADRFVRVVEGGEVTDDIAVDAHAIACALGGDDGRALFMLTATSLGNAEQSRAQRRARIDTTRVRVPGAERP